MKKTIHKETTSFPSRFVRGKHQLGIKRRGGPGINPKTYTKHDYEDWRGGNGLAVNRKEEIKEKKENVTKKQNRITRATGPARRAAVRPIGERSKAQQTTEPTSSAQSAKVNSTFLLAL